MMDKKCRDAIEMTIWASRTMPEIFTFSDLIGNVCQDYGTEFVAKCIMEMGLEVK